MTTELRSQAKRVFDKFGGVPKLHRALKLLGPTSERHISAIYKWDLPRDKGGTGGIIPSSAQKDVRRAARLEGIALTSDDWNPERMP